MSNCMGKRRVKKMASGAKVKSKMQQMYERESGLDTPEKLERARKKARSTMLFGPKEKSEPVSKKQRRKMLEESNENRRHQGRADQAKADRKKSDEAKAKAKRQKTADEQYARSYRKYKNEESKGAIDRALYRAGDKIGDVIRGAGKLVGSNTMTSRDDKAQMQARKDVKGNRAGGSVKKMANGKKSFPDLNKDGKITQADILKGRGVGKAYGGKINKMATGGKVKARRGDGICLRGRTKGKMV